MIPFKKLEETLGKDNVLRDEPLKKHINFRTGGNADCFITPETKEDLVKALKILEGESSFLLGNGSNILVKDNGFRGTVISTEKLKEISCKENIITAQAGALLRDIAGVALDNSLTGYEFASGIPGSIGGAVKMNAGAYGGEHKDVVLEATVIDNGEVKTLKNKDLKFSYRNSLVKEKDLVVLEVKIGLKKGEKESIREKQEELNKKRRDKQPLEYPSAGSTFKRPEGDYASRLIDICGLRGLSIGGAQVSKKHAGFIINKDNATAEDVLKLIDKVKKEVEKQTGKVLEEEVIVIGE